MGCEGEEEGDVAECSLKWLLKRCVVHVCQIGGVGHHGTVKDVCLYHELLHLKSSTLSNVALHVLTTGDEAQNIEGQATGQVYTARG